MAKKTVKKTVKKKTAKKAVKKTKDPYEEILNELGEYEKGTPQRTRESVQD